MVSILKKTISLLLPCTLCTLFLYQCAHTKIEPYNKQKTKPVILFWTDYPQELVNITHITPHVDIEESNTNEDINPYISQKYLLERGILPLKWRGGMVHADRTEEDLVEDWCSAKKEGYLGIAIDEFGSWRIGVNGKLANALVEAKRRCPELFIAVWHAGPLTGQLAEAYRVAADLIMIEAYFSGTSLLWFHFAFNIAAARMTGIIHKTVFALGINDGDENVRQKKRRGWANTPEELEAQIKWIRKYAPEMPGIAFFAPRASIELLKKADALAGEIFK